MSSPGYRVRRSFRDIEREHYQARKDGSKESTELERMILAWKGIQEMDPDDFKSFFVIAGYHGEPFRGAGWGSSSWWGGYCNHGNILFPTWHRAYLYRLEEALRSIPGCEDVTLAYWDETDDLTKASGVPETFGLRKFKLGDGTEIDNPLFSYKFQKGIFDNIPNDATASGSGANYSKPRHYETVRYPLSGIVEGSDDVIKATKEHNDKYKNDEQNWSLLNANVEAWLSPSVTIPDAKPPVLYVGVREQYRHCLDAPNYTVFSNQTSASAYNEENFEVTGWQDSADPTKVPQASHAIVPLETPHNNIHLAVGGFDLATIGVDQSAIEGANGDMGENDTAGFDPIFYFHHCFVDRVFWLWQQKHGQTKQLTMDAKFANFPGTNSVDGQNPTPGRQANSWLSLDTPLEPFRKEISSQEGEYMTSMDVIDIEGSLGYTYGPGSLTDLIDKPTNGNVDHHETLIAPAEATPILRVSGVRRGAHAGSMVVSAWANLDGKNHLVAVEPILSRWHLTGCANCQNHLSVTTFLTLHGLQGKDVDHKSVSVWLHTREKPKGFQHKGVINHHLGHSRRRH